MGSVLAVAVWLIVGAVAVAAIADVVARRRGRPFRSSAVMYAERLDLHRDMESTQHRGIAPIGDICRDRQRHR